MKIQISFVLKKSKLKNSDQFLNLKKSDLKNSDKFFEFKEIKQSTGDFEI